MAHEGYPRAAQLADLVLPAVGSIERALTGRGSPYAHVLAAVYAEFAALAERVPAKR
jgi:hypothetical protein